MAGKIVIDTERCKGCGLCVSVCPQKSLAISKKSNKNGYFPAETLHIDCTGCAMCAVICPETVIEVSKQPNGTQNAEHRTQNTADSVQFNKF